jgi:hypothetical protein
MTITTDTTRIPSRFLALLAGLHGPDDLAPDRIAEAIGMPVAHDPEDRGRYGAGAAVDAHWACNLASIPDRGGGPPKRLVFSYDRTGGDAHDVPASAPEFDAFAQALREAGYAQEPVHGPRGALWGHRFLRGGVEVQVTTEREDAHAAQIRLRVSRVTVDTSEAGHG